LDPHRIAIRKLPRLLLLLSLLAGLTGCQSQPVYVTPPDWKYADLRALDPADNIPPSQDLIALYIRRLGADIEIRLDLVDLSIPVDGDLRLQIDSPSSSEIVFLDIFASGDIRASSESGLIISGLQPRVTRDTFLDTVAISLDRASLLHNGMPFEVTAYSLESGSLTLRDQIGPVRSDALPPRQAEVLFAFWDTFPAETPAQALRVWDGAHSGPERSRYGLHHLLSAVKAYHVPVFLLDLKTPNTISILDYMGKYAEVQSLADCQLAVLPAVARYDLPSNLLSRIPIRSFTPYTTSAFLYTSGLPSDLNNEVQVVFISSNRSEIFQTTYPFRWQTHTIIPVPDNEYGPDYKATSDGPSQDLRRDLIRSTFTSPGGIFLLGGKLANSSWGDPARVSPTLQYLSAHPWIHFLTVDNLLTLHTKDPYEPHLSSEGQNPLQANQTLEALLVSPPGEITDLAWQTYLSLLTPAAPELVELRAGYFGIIGHMLTAAQWAARPGTLADCTADIDWDGLPECILASPDFFATFETGGGYVVTAFARRGDRIHQVIAPYAQFTTGLGDPSTWNPGRGSEGDPALVPGAFVDGTRAWTPQVQGMQITFTNPENHASKTFSLTDTGLSVEYNAADPITVKIALALDPWRRFSTGWGDAYHETTLPNGWEWSLETGIQVAMTTSGTINAQAFTASRAYLSGSENPNFDYPPGHYLPFPLALVDITGQGSLWIHIDIR
jgi:hypothetical protein